MGENALSPRWRLRFGDNAHNVNSLGSRIEYADYLSLATGILARSTLIVEAKYGGAGRQDQFASQMVNAVLRARTRRPAHGL